MFIRKKGKYYYIVESYRENGKVRQRNLAYLGDEPDIPRQIIYSIGTLWRLKRNIPKIEDDIGKVKDWGEVHKLSRRQCRGGGHSRRYNSRIRRARHLIEDREKLSEYKAELEGLPDKINRLREYAAHFEQSPTYDEGSEEYEKLISDYDGASRALNVILSSA